MQYFDHSTDAANDTKVMALRIECGGEAVDAYWYVVEQLHRDEQPLCVSDALAMRVHCHTLCTDVETLKKWFDAMVSVGLLEYDEERENLSSTRTTENIEKYREKCDKAASAAKKRWSNADAPQGRKRKQSNRNADAMPTKQNKGFGFDKQNQKPNASDGAAAADAAPASAPHCPLCGVKVFHNPQTGKFDCTTCHDSFEREKVVFK